MPSATDKERNLEQRPSCLISNTKLYPCAGLPFPTADQHPAPNCTATHCALLQNKQPSQQLELFAGTTRETFRCDSNSSTRVENPEARSSLERYRRRWEDNIKLGNPETR
jgi:hypothetical protein